MESNAPNGKENSSSPLKPRAALFVPAASSSPFLASSPAAAIQFGLPPAVSPPLLVGSPLAGSAPRYSPWVPPSRSPGRRPAAGDTEGQMAFEQEKLRRSQGGSMDFGAGGNIQTFSGYQAPQMQGWHPNDMAGQQQQYQMSLPQQQHQYYQSLPGLQGPYQYPAAVYQQQYQMLEAHYQPAFVAQAPMEPAYVYQSPRQQQQFYEQQAAMEPVYHYQPHLAEQQHRHQPAPMERQSPTNAPRGPRRHTLDPPINLTPGGSRHPGRRRGPRRSDNGFHRPYPFASPGYEGYIINGSDNNTFINNDNMPCPPSDRPLASVPETPPHVRPTIRLPGMNQPRTTYGIPGQTQNNRAAYNPYTNFQPTGALARGVEHPNRGNFTFGGASAQSQPHNSAAMTPPPQGSCNSFTPAQGQSFGLRAATTTNMSLVPAASHTYAPIAPCSSATGSRVAPAPSHERTALALRQAQAQASTRSEPAQTHNVMPPSHAQGFVIVNMPPIPRRPTAEQLSFGPPPSSSPIMTYNFPGQPLTARGQPIDLPRPRQTPLAVVNSLVAREFDVPSEPVNQGNLAQQILTNDLDNQARTAPAFERGELTFMDNGNYRRDLERRQHAAAQRAAERWARGEITEEQARKESMVRGWDIQEWKVAGEGGRGRRYSKSEGGL